MTSTGVPRVGHLALLSTVLAAAVTRAAPPEDLKVSKAREASVLAGGVIDHFMMLFLLCSQNTMPQQQFLIDDLQTFVNYPAKTTVGVVPRFTSNRKFFANLITTPQFKAMLSKDEQELRRNLVKKLAFCENSVMDQYLLREMYDREVDQSKI